MSDQRFGTAAHRYLPAGTDVAADLHHGDEQALPAVWSTYQRHRLLRAALTELATSDTIDTDPRSAADHLRATLTEHAALAEVTPAQALEANRRLIELLTTRQWPVIREAREAGDDWTTIGAALQMTDQDAADRYTREVAHQETAAPRLHDTDRAATDE
ncbi:hypothetical protein CJ469_06042 [Nocardia farcinica]|uniref:hypothetical protein n=1 Tax=Nocardia farcinica TaxID=37329 RepID=UPI000BF747EE|nr:hypothetical protein [Nocardia farcinica]PFW98641.1 hypothetical protein CJ469_06042 [Nocardia farcinica]PFX03255.1 hypothetical protein CJ468_05658 [Nocardia farcinica]SUE28390.1 Uncharacterised protein [Nocardia farcinica]